MIYDDNCSLIFTNDSMKLQRLFFFLRRPQFFFRKGLSFVFAQDKACKVFGGLEWPPYKNQITCLAMVVSQQEGITGSDRYSKVHIYNSRSPPLLHVPLRTS